MATKRNPRQREAEQPETSDDLIPMQRVHANSLANRIAELDIGESLSQAQRLDTDTEVTRETITIHKNRLKSILSSHSSRASARSGNRYTNEVGHFFTQSNDVIVVAVVTRLS